MIVFMQDLIMVLVVNDVCGGRSSERQMAIWSVASERPENAGHGSPVPVLAA
jgi:hypothetical protein